MSKFTKKMVDMYADKLLIGLTEEENKMVLDEFDVIEESMEVLANIPDIEKVEPMPYALDDFTYTLREDKADISPSLDELLQNCEDVEDGFVSVPKVVG